ncbi:hypothetical protein V6N13_049695 [Hibiscus sabdariffa]
MGFISESSEDQQHIGSQSGSEMCVRKGVSDCHNGEEFLKLDGIKLPDSIDVSLNESMNLKECEVNCLKNCSCRGYAGANFSNPNGGCLMWFGDLIDVIKVTGESKGSEIFIRVPSSELEQAYNHAGYASDRTRNSSEEAIQQEFGTGR